MDSERTTVKFELSMRDVPEERLLVVRDHVPMAELKAAIPAALERVGALFREAGARPPGPPVAVTGDPDADGLVEVAAGWPRGDVAAQPPVEELVLPATRALVLKHTGPYQELPHSYRLLQQAIAENGLHPAGDPREVYVGDPSVTAPADLETLIVWPMAPGDELPRPRDVFYERV